MAIDEDTPFWSAPYHRTPEMEEEWNSIALQCKGRIDADTRERVVPVFCQHEGDYELRAEACERHGLTVDGRDGSNLVEVSRKVKGDGDGA